MSDAAVRVNRGRNTLYSAGLVAIVVTAYWPITRIMLRQGDFPYHIGFAVALAQGDLTVPHFLFHTLTAEGILLGLSPVFSAAATTLGFQILAAWGVSWIAQRSGASVGVATCLGICAVLVAPILPLEVAAEADLYPVGYFLPNALHSPTVTAAKAFVPFLIELGVMVCGAAAAWSWSSVAAIVILAGLAKPHYVSCLLPMVAAVCAWRWWRGRQVSWGPLLSFVAAAVAVLGWTAVGTPALAGGGTAIIAPLAVLRSWGGVDVPVDALSIVVRACSDLAFPIAVLVLWPDARRFPALVLAWAAYAIGLGQGLLLAETGHRMYDGNFMWSAQLATFGVLAASAAWLGRSSVRWNWRAIVAWSVLLLHVAYGVWWITARVAAR